MAINPSGYGEHRSAQVRRVLYISIVVIVVAVVAIAGIILKRSRGGSQEPQANTTEQGQPAEPNAAPVAMDANGSVVSAQIAQAMELLNQPTPKIIEARDRLNELLPLAQGQELLFIKGKLAELSDKWLFGKLVYSEDKLTSSYKVAPGDMLSTIGKRHNVPYEILMQINNMAKPEALQSGVAIKVINGPFHARVYRSTFTMDLYLQNTYVKSFSVGLGKQGMETPTGRWRAKEGGKLIQPIWTDPVTGKTYHPEDPDYPLGSRWIALEGIEGNAVGKKGFAIHGTKNPEQIGTPGSQGCIRLHNGDAILVYNLMVPGQSLVDVVD
jgi:lipoprotein-anchoring transpeptidase ErfK/SrfK